MNSQGLRGILVAVAQIVVVAAAAMEDRPADIGVLRFRRRGEQRPHEDDVPIGVAGLVQDVAWGELAHPGVGLKLPAGSRIVVQVDRLLLKDILDPDDGLLERSRQPGWVEIPGVALRGRHRQEGRDFHVSTTGKDEPARVWVDVMDEAAEVPALVFHAGKDRGHLALAHVGVAHVCSERRVVVDDVLARLRRSNQREDRRARVHVHRRPSRFALEVGVDVVQNALAQIGRGQVGDIVGGRAVLDARRLRKGQVMACVVEVVLRVAPVPDPFRDGFEGLVDVGQELLELPAVVDVLDTKPLGVDGVVLDSESAGRLAERDRLSRRQAGIDRIAVRDSNARPTVAGQGGEGAFEGDSADSDAHAVHPCAAILGFKADDGTTQGGALKHGLLESPVFEDKLLGNGSAVCGNCWCGHDGRKRRRLNVFAESANARR